MKKVGENPPARFPDRPIAEAPQPWWVAKVKPRMEKALAFDFLNTGTEYYLPLYTHVIRRRDNNKPRKSILPLFPGYIAFSMTTPHNIFITGRVVNIVEVRHQKRFVRELTQIQSALEKGVVVEPCDTAFEIGQTVEVHAGPLRGLVGVVARIRDSDRLVLSVDGLGRAMVTIEPAYLRPVKRKDSDDEAR